MLNSKIERVSAIATKSCHKHLVTVDRAMIDSKVHDARQSDRKREIHMFHTGDEDLLQRMLNAIQPGSYITPHRHHEPPKAESIVLLQGALGYVFFDDNGVADDTNFVLLDLKRGFYAIDTRPSVWHTFFAVEPDTVVFEVKPGPYDSSSDKEFATWAPFENSENATNYLMNIEDRFRAIWNLSPRIWR